MNEHDHVYSRSSHHPLPSPRSHPSHIQPSPSLVHPPNGPYYDRERLDRHERHERDRHDRGHDRERHDRHDRHDRHSIHMTRHDSYQYASPTHPRAPPPLRTAQSFAASSSSSLIRKADKDDPDELTTKGRKRKRLAKACSACHKNKRRCDGFAPCSNCEFSSRPCLYLNAVGDPIPPPRTRDSSDAPAPRIGNDGKEEIVEPRAINSRITGDRRLPDALEAVDRDPNISLELIDHFFHQIHPVNGMFHSPTFYDRLYRGHISPVLLDCMYAMSCRYATSSNFVACFPAKAPPHTRAQPFVERARSGLDRLLSARRNMSPEEIAQQAGTWEETEVAQACIIFSLYLTLAMQTTLGMYYADTARDMLTLTPAGLVPAPTAVMGLSKTEHITLLEARNRTYWGMSWLQKCWIAVGRPTGVMGDGNVPLPGAESFWSRYGGSSCAETGVIRRRDSLTERLGDWSGEEGAVGELGYVMRIMDLATRITALAGSATHGSQSSAPVVQQYQEQLKIWAQELPDHLRFDERNLTWSADAISNHVPSISSRGWLWAYMHALAECSMFFLQAIVALQPNSTWTAERQGQAVENLGVILNGLGDVGRSCPMVIFPLCVITNWQDHVKSCGTLTSAQRQFEERLNGWWAAHEQMWGVDRRTSDRLHEFHEEKRDVLPFTVAGRQPQPPSIERTPTSAFSRQSESARTRDSYHPPSSSTAWQHVLPSPPNMTDTGTTASWTLPPPTPGSASYGLTQSASHSGGWTRNNLPSARPRAHSNAAPYSALMGRSPSPESLGRRHLPSMSALNDREDGLRLPPLNELRVSHGHGHSLRSPGEIGRASAFGRMTPSPRGKGDALGLALSAGAGYIKEREYGPSSRDDKAGQQESLGIAALISAAESEQAREDEERRSRSRSIGVTKGDVQMGSAIKRSPVVDFDEGRMGREVSPLSRA